MNEDDKHNVEQLKGKLETLQIDDLKKKIANDGGLGGFLVKRMIDFNMQPQQERRESHKYNKIAGTFGYK
jgi:hypothetical protein